MGQLGMTKPICAAGGGFAVQLPWPSKSLFEIVERDRGVARSIARTGAALNPPKRIRADPDGLHEQGFDCYIPST